MCFLWSMSSPSFSLEPDGVFGRPPSKTKRSSTASFPFMSVCRSRGCRVARRARWMFTGHRQINADTSISMLRVFVAHRYPGVDGTVLGVAECSFGVGRFQDPGLHFITATVCLDCLHVCMFQSKRRIAVRRISTRQMAQSVYP